MLVSPRLKGLNTPMKIYSYLDSGSAVLATRLRTHTQVLDDGIAYLVEPEPVALGRRSRRTDGRPRAARATGELGQGLRAARAHAGGGAAQAGRVLHHDGIPGAAVAGVRRLWRSATLRSVAVLGLSGLGFAVANLLLARALPTEQYAVLTLVVALVNVGYPLAAAGVDGIVNRRRLEAGPRLLRRLLHALVPVALVFTSSAWLAYETSLPVALMILLGTIAAGGALLVAGAQFQSEQRFGISLALYQSPNLVLLLAALWVVVAGARDGPRAAAGLDRRLRRHRRGRLVDALPGAPREAAPLGRIPLERGGGDRRPERGGAPVDPARAAAHSPPASAARSRHLRRPGARSSARSFVCSRWGSAIPCSPGSGPRRAWWSGAG